MKVSIIIPTAFDGLESRLKPCLESIQKFTDLTDTEIIVVKNGCTWITDLPGIQVLSFNEAIGYPAAINAGINVAKGEYIVLLNDDTILLEQPKNQWIEILLRAFWDEKMAIAGPWMNWCPWAEHDFLIFFCVMIRKSVFERIGVLDEKAFGVGYGEDCDLCCKSKAAGYKISQVPIPDKLDYDGRMAIGQFPIYHAGNQTFANWPGGEELLRKNRDILHERYGTNIGKAHNCDGWMSDGELRWLAQEARKSETVIELGSWHGKSSRAIADNLPADGKLYCIDTWAGSIAEQDTNHVSAKWMDGDHAFDEFARNLWDHIESGKVVPLRMHGRHAAKLLQDNGVKADLIFVDAGHTYPEVQEDIHSFLPLRKDGGIMSGHDYMMGTAPEVTQAVLDIFKHNIGNTETIWYTDSNPTPQKPKIYDCFIFNNEYEVLERRLSELNDVVDRFVIVEANKTHSGKSKAFNFEHMMYHYTKYLPKITHIMVDDLPEVEGTITDKSWSRERFQRDAIMRGLTDCKDNDIILISDVDELVSPEAIQLFNGSEICALQMKLFYYNEETEATESWTEAKILTYRKLKELTPCGARYHQTSPIIFNAGKHLSYFGGVQQIMQKLEDTAHQEYNTPEFKDPNRIQKAIQEKRDLFDRDYVKFQ